MEVTDDKGSIQLLIGLKYTVTVADDGSPIQNTPHYTILVLCETRVPIQDRVSHIPLSLKKRQIHVYQFIFYSNVGGFNPTPKYV